MDIVKIADRLKAGVALVVIALMIFVLYVSKDHITAVALAGGLVGYQAYTLFILVDLPVLIGKVMSLKYFAHSTRAFGKKLAWVSGILSLAANVLAGALHGEIGQAAYGAFIVGLFLTLEVALTKIKAAAAVTKAKNAAKQAETTAPPAPATLTARQIGARNGVATRARNRAMAGSASN